MPAAEQVRTPDQRTRLAAQNKEAFQLGSTRFDLRQRNDERLADSSDLLYISTNLGGMFSLSCALKCQILHRVLNLPAGPSEAAILFGPIHKRAVTNHLAIQPRNGHVGYSNKGTPLIVDTLRGVNFDSARRYFDAYTFQIFAPTQIARATFYEVAKLALFEFVDVAACNAIAVIAPQKGVT